MGMPSVQGLDFRILLGLLPFGLHARRLQSLREVLLDTFGAPDIATTHFDRWR
jgi:hypothetical protein